MVEKHKKNRNTQVPSQQKLSRLEKEGERRAISVETYSINNNIKFVSLKYTIKHKI